MLAVVVDLIFFGQINNWYTYSVNVICFYDSHKNDILSTLQAEASNSCKPPSPNISEYITAKPVYTVHIWTLLLYDFRKSYFPDDGQNGIRPGKSNGKDKEA